ncbi:MAG: hypothetical protein HQK83_16665 [Fibrobacteria bacterium]|nr:hypothetical protein [Fibrobacteria bacterium]
MIAYLKKEGLSESDRHALLINNMLFMHRHRMNKQDCYRVIMDESMSDDLNRAARDGQKCFERSQLLHEKKECMCYCNY